MNDKVIEWIVALLLLAPYQIILPRSYDLSASIKDVRAKLDRIQQAEVDSQQKYFDAVTDSIRAEQRVYERMCEDKATLLISSSQLSCQRFNAEYLALTRDFQARAIWYKNHTAK